MIFDYKLSSNDDLTLSIKKYNIENWLQLADHIKSLPYGRNSNRKDPSLVWLDQKGTCSSKHAFLKWVADLNNIPNVELMLGMYKMNATNTPKIGNVLKDYQLDYIPEAHCYLKLNEERIDFTSINAQFGKIKNDILLETIINPDQVAKFKVDFHQVYLKDWIKTYQIPFSFDEIWKIREQCIINLSA